MYHFSTIILWRRRVAFVIRGDACFGGAGDVPHVIKAVIDQKSGFAPMAAYRPDLISATNHDSEGIWSYTRNTVPTRIDFTIRSFEGDTLVFTSPSFSAVDGCTSTRTPSL